MCFGGGSSSPTVVNTTTNSIPGYLQDASRENINIANSLAQRPYPLYPGPRLAGFSPGQAAGMNLARSSTGSWRPGVRAASSTASEIGRGTVGEPTAAEDANNLRLYGPDPNTWPAGVRRPREWEQQFGTNYAGRPASFDPSRFFNPAMSFITDRIAHEGARARAGITRSAAASGAHGSGRHGVVEARQLLDQDRAVGEAAAAQWGRATGDYFTEQQQRLAAAGLGADVARTGSELGQRDIGNLMSVGGAEQEQEQAGMSLAYEDFLRQYGFPIEMLNMRQAAVAGTPYTTNSMTTGPGPNRSAQNLAAFAALAGGLGVAGGARGIPGLWGG